MPVSEGEPRRPLYKNPFLWAFVLGALALVAIRPMQDAMLAAPPPLAEIGEWTLTDHEGEPFGSKDLAGKVWVADFFFTRCPSICPELTRKMKTVEERFEKYGDDVHFVSFTVDPEYDTPAKLKAYAEKMSVDTSRWTFVTGPQDEMRALITGQMFLHVGEKQAIEGSGDGEPTLFDISHLGRFVLFDQNGDMRATFSTDLEGLGALGNATRLLVERGPAP